MQMIKCTKCMKDLEEGVRICPYCGYDQEGEPQPPHALKRNTILRGKYLIGNVIGQGGFGITYVGFDLTLEMKVAIKEYYPSGLVSRTNTYSNELQWDFAASEQRRQQGDGIDRFLKEARRMARLDAVPSVVRVRDSFGENQTAYIVMDFVEGDTLKNYLLSHGVMKWDECSRILTPILDSLAIIHENGFIHRDISPDNIMIQPDGTARLLDMGAAVDMSAHNGQASMAVVKRSFSAPEQYVEGKTLGSWTDVYSMAATIYYCLTGKTAPEAMERVYNHTSVTFPDNIAIPQQIKNALISAMETDVGRRTKDMREFKRQLMAAQTAGGSQSVSGGEIHTGFSGGNGKGFSGNSGQASGKKLPKWLIAAAGAVAVLILVLVVVYGTGGSDPATGRNVDIIAVKSEQGGADTAEDIVYDTYTNDTACFSIDYPSGYMVTESGDTLVLVTNDADADFQFTAEYAWVTTGNSAIYSAEDFADQIADDETVLADWLGVSGLEAERLSTNSIAGLSCYAYGFSFDFNGDDYLGEIYLVDTQGEFGCYSLMWAVNTLTGNAELYEKQCRAMAETFEINGAYQTPGYSIYTYDSIGVTFMLDESKLEGEVDEYSNPDYVVVHPFAHVYSEAYIIISETAYDISYDASYVMENIGNYYFKYRDNTVYTTEWQSLDYGRYECYAAALSYEYYGKDYTVVIYLMPYGDSYWEIYMVATDDYYDTTLSLASDALFSLVID